MRAWWRRLMEDEAAFAAFASKVQRTGVRFGLALAGVLVFTGKIPTGIDGGNQYGLWLIAFALGIPVGDRTPPELLALVKRLREHGGLPPT